MESLLFHLGMIIVGLEAAGVLLVLFAVWSAPLGYEDETGFHYGVDPRSVAMQEAPLAPAHLWHPLWGAF